MNTIERSIYQHAGRGRLRIPMDARLGIVEGGYTPKLARVLTHGIAVMTDEDAAGFVEEVGLATVSSSTFHRPACFTGSLNTVWPSPMGRFQLGFDSWRAR